MPSARSLSSVRCLALREPCKAVGISASTQSWLYHLRGILRRRLESIGKLSADGWRRSPMCVYIPRARPAARLVLNRRAATARFLTESLAGVARIRHLPHSRRSWMTMRQPRQSSCSPTTSRRPCNLSTWQVQCMRIMKQVSINEWGNQSHRHQRHHPVRPEASFASILLAEWPDEPHLPRLPVRTASIMALKCLRSVLGRRIHASTSSASSSSSQ